MNKCVHLEVSDRCPEYSAIFHGLLIMSACKCSISKILQGNLGWHFLEGKKYPAPLSCSSIDTSKSSLLKSSILLLLRVGTYY